MGTWGYEPKHNDTAMDIAATAMDATADLLAKLCGRNPPVRRGGTPELWITRLFARNYDDGRPGETVNTAHRWARAGAVQYAIEQGVIVTGGVIETIVNDLRAVLADAEYAKSWDDPAAFKRTARRFEQRFEQLIEDRRGKPRWRQKNVYPWVGWPRAKPRRPPRPIVSKVRR